MIIKSSTALRNNCGTISDLAHKEAEQREETLKLRAKLEAAEAARLSGAPAYTLEESRKRITCRPASHAGLLVCYVLLLRFQMLHGGVHQFQLLLRGTGQLLDIFQRLLGLELCQLLPKLLLRLL